MFISYSSKDPNTVNAICHELEENGIRCWMAPRDIPVGSKYATVINHAIPDAKAVVLIFSERSAVSPLGGERDKYCIL
uniref:toll/interleukin-1 receptor domain-containing protein n=1 Tax=Alistipes sp. TaxID=1872444 RepID=UPI0040574FAB